MWTSLRVAVSGALAQERVLDVSGNNLANLETTGYKSRRADLVEARPDDRLYGAPDAGTPDLTYRPLGGGVSVGSIAANLAPGPLRESRRALDLAIAGQGWLAVAQPDGSTAYTRDGALFLDADRRLVTAAGRRLLPEIALPEGAVDVSIGSDGQVLARLSDGSWQTAGQIPIVRFPNPDGLVAAGQNLFVAGPAAGAPETGRPGESGFGRIVPGALEASNVQVGDELVRLIQAQRAYQVNLRAIRTIDEMLQTAYSLRR